MVYELNQSCEDEHNYKTPDCILVNRTDFMNLLITKTDIIIIKFTADWCKPCSIIKDMVHENVSKLPEKIKFYEIDVDEAFDLYAFLKTKKMVGGIPTLLAYFKTNTTYASDLCITGTSKVDIDAFFVDVLREFSKEL